MKIKLIFTALSIVMVSMCYSQGFTFGIKGGASINKLTGKSFSEQFSFGYHVGGFVTFNLGGKLGLQPEIIFSQVNSDTSSSFSSVYQFNNIDKVKLSYLSIPILLNYNVSNLVALQAGPQFSILMDQNVSLAQNGKDAFKKGDFALAAGLQVKVLKFKVYGRYLIGLTNLNDVSSSEKWKNQSIQLGVGLAF
ncbi:hypothetical protein BH09BAC2_BH09BAC2_12090 [soil metagenome]